MLKRKQEEVKEEVVITPLRPIDESSKDECLFLLSELQRLNIRSISDLENKIARL